MITLGAPPLFPSDRSWPSELLIEVDEDERSVEVWRRSVLETEKVGHVVLSDAANFPLIGPVSQVMNSYLSSSYKNQGIGKALYLIAMEEFGAIHPDWTGDVSKQAWRVWRSLQEIPYVDWMDAQMFGVSIRQRGKTNYPDEVEIQVDWPVPAPDIETYSTLSNVYRDWRGILDQVYWLEEPVLWEA